MKSKLKMSDVLNGIRKLPKNSKARANKLLATAKKINRLNKILRANGAHPENVSENKRYYEKNSGEYAIAKRLSKKLAQVTRIAEKANKKPSKKKASKKKASASKKKASKKSSTVSARKNKRASKKAARKAMVKQRKKARKTIKKRATAIRKSVKKRVSSLRRYAKKHKVAASAIPASLRRVNPHDNPSIGDIFGEVQQMLPAIAAGAVGFVAALWLGTKIRDVLVNDIMKDTDPNSVLNKHGAMIGTGMATIGAYAALRMVGKGQYARYAMPVLLGGAAATLAHALFRVDDSGKSLASSFGLKALGDGGVFGAYEPPVRGDDRTAWASDSSRYLNGYTDDNAWVQESGYGVLSEGIF